MHTVRVYLNRQDGTTWWAEDDLGFTGGADRLSDLIEKIHDWAGCEGVLDDLAVRLVSDPPETPTVNPFSVTGLYVPWSAGTGGVLRVEPAMIAV
ncbi:MAG: hypothetical protein OXS29_14900 [bacterium]|nr:hypothetical protein [bacterium]MDE0288915.1 hypothetical protein [bacterium]MDE0437524.1 hypothetical protein [bacterium]